MNRIGTALTVSTLMISPALAPGSSPGPTPAACQWPLDSSHLDAQKAWALSQGDGVTVAVIDTGVDAGDPDLHGRILPGEDLTGQSADGRVDTSSDSHGTSVAAIIAGNGGPADGSANGPAAIAGLAAQSSILPVRVATTNGTAITPLALSEGIAFAVRHGAGVINISITTDISNPEVSDAVSYAISHDVVVVAAAGNEGAAANPVMYPAALPGVVAVAGTTRANSRWPLSESGSYITLAAPAEGICSLSDSGGAFTASGTSYSAPFVAATAALLRSRYPHESAAQIITRLIATATAPSSTTNQTAASGRGIVDPAKALTAPEPTATTNPLLSRPAPTPEPNAATAKSRTAGSTSSSRNSVIAVISGMVLAVVVALFGGLWAYRRWSHKQKQRREEELRQILLRQRKQQRRKQRRGSV
ncbi:S8 family serine peptidase [Catenulispora sp. NL8]|uniref:S8 family serine peptidase n=1 Tax=Catenulispora pinistramenti TaxID=2705254 RepID=A0ABS5KRA7_9ACTN|nr:S8 family serine peptidase [Catenulispora pinistramenti]MBS2548550.1 S8 family serine peptidase [Catenulispora pinistramenti]